MPAVIDADGLWLVQQACGSQCSCTSKHLFRQKKSEPSLGLFLFPVQLSVYFSSAAESRRGAGPSQRAADSERQRVPAAVRCPSATAPALPVVLANAVLGPSAVQDGESDEAQVQVCAFLWVARQTGWEHVMKDLWWTQNVVPRLPRVCRSAPSHLPSIILPKPAESCRSALPLTPGNLAPLWSLGAESIGTLYTPASIAS